VGEEESVSGRRQSHLTVFQVGAMYSGEKEERGKKKVPDSQQFRPKKEKRGRDVFHLPRIPIGTETGGEEGKGGANGLPGFRGGGGEKLERKGKRRASFISSAMKTITIKRRVRGGGEP